MRERFPLPRRALALAALAILAVALAATALSTTRAGGAGSGGPTRLTVTGATSPARTGTAAAPVAVAAQVLATTRAPAGRRPVTAQFVRLRMAGLRIATSGLPSCTAAQVTTAGSTRPCPAGSRLGRGGLDLVLGASGDAASITGRCHLDLSLFDAGPRELTLFLSGGPAAPQTCPATVTAAVPLAVGRPPGATSLSVTLPDAVLHPIGGFDAALSQLQLVLPATVVRSASGRVSPLTSVGGCSRGRRALAGFVSFDDGSQASASVRVACAGPGPAGARHRPGGTRPKPPVTRPKPAPPRRGHP